ncbi:MAG TPA: SDR family oxidoreductase [Syntrophorhabdaceae bacterium]|nr:SDR family oxidoreductase [Syntrophorhabdaceae bacterium]
MELKNLTAIVTGSGKGIGKTIAEKFAEEGARVALWDVDMNCFAGVASGPDRLIQKVNVKNEDEVVAAVEKVVKEFGRIDVLVNNAGISRHKPIEEMTLDLWNEVIDINLKGVFLCCKAVIPVMKNQKRGKIVNIASLGARTGRPGVGINYAASKAGVIAITQTLAKEVGPSGIYINAIAPGPILTEQTRQYPPEVFATWNVGRAIPKDGLPEDVADGAIFLASSRSDWITGITLDLNGGIFIP